MTTRQEKVRELKRIGQQFRMLQKVSQTGGSFKSMQQATICAGLAEVCDMLALLKKERENGKVPLHRQWNGASSLLLKLLEEALRSAKSKSNTRIQATLK